MQSLPRGFEVAGNSFTLTNSYDPFVSTNYIKYLQVVGDRNIYVYGEGGVDLLEINSYFFQKQDGSFSLSEEEKAYNFYDKKNPVTLNLFGGGWRRSVGFFQ